MELAYRPAMLHLTITGGGKIKVKTENLTILFVDIAGFTVATSRQSRQENAQFLHVFNSTLLPMIARFDGRHIKSIGDALLLTFRSPTDAMLCAMALQDAMHAHNLKAGADAAIHIRVAAHLGEVRVVKKDIFGEPVNVTARIEGITPSEEIYLSEAVYMAMNKAEVPAQEVGFHELRGVAQPVRLYNIPRFSTHRLVPVEASRNEQGGELLYPYGGMHCRAGDKRLGGLLTHEHMPSRGPVLATLAVIGLLTAAGFAGWFFLRGATPAAESMTQASPAASKQAAIATAAGTAAAAPPAASIPVAIAAVASSTAATPAAAPPATSPARPLAKPQPRKTARADTPLPREKTVTPRREAPPPEQPRPARQQQWTLASAKQAYREERLSKQEYKQVVVRLKSAYEDRIDQLKADYRAGRLSKAEYAAEVRAAKIELKRGD